MALHVRPLSESEQAQIEKLAHSRTAFAHGIRPTGGTSDHHLVIQPGVVGSGDC